MQIGMMRGWRLVLVLASGGAGMAFPAAAHVSERALVLLLPTGAYITAGLAVVIATLALIIWVPMRPAPPVRADRGDHPALLPALLGLALFVVAVGLGLWGARNPLTNPLVVLVWTGFWIILPVVQICGLDLWRHVSPFALIARFAPAPMVRLPQSWGAWPAIVTFLMASVFALVDIAPDDPDRLARAVLAYWAATLALTLVFGRDWLLRGEAATVFLTLLARMGQGRLAARSCDISLGLFALTALAVGSFDGLNETFLWLDIIGVNPLEFPGRSAVQGVNSLGVLALTLGLWGLFAGLTALGFARARQPMRGALGPLALAVLPIAAGYHVAHYLTTFLVSGQYALLSLTDPLGRGSDLLGLGEFYVTTGMFNKTASVRTIWLTQAGAVVLGHVASLILAHRIALRETGDHAAALAVQAPISLFMLAYTFFGLWLLATPTGM